MLASASIMVITVVKLFSKMILIKAKTQFHIIYHMKLKGANALVMFCQAKCLTINLVKNCWHHIGEQSRKILATASIKLVKRVTQT